MSDKNIAIEQEKIALKRELRTPENYSSMDFIATRSFRELCEQANKAIASARPNLDKLRSIRYRLAAFHDRSKVV